METRKIQKVGGSTFTVSVPKGWADRQGLEAGETVQLFYHRDDSLLIRGAETDEDALAHIQFPVHDEAPATVERLLRAAYVTGFEQVTLVPEETVTEAQRRAASLLARRLVGMEVAESTTDRIVVRAMLDPGAVSVRQTIVQLQSITLSMLEMAIDGLAGDAAVATRVRDRHDDVQRLLALLRRHYNRSLIAFAELDALGVDRPELSAYCSTATHLVGVADESLRLAATTDRASLSDDRATDLEDRSGEVQTAIENATAALLEDASVATALDRLDRQDAVLEALEDVVTVDEETDVQAVRAIDSLQRIAKHGQAIAAVAVRSAIRSTSSI